MKKSRTKLNYLAWIQGVYYSATGIWPIIHIQSFMGITGPKTDLWLVRTVGMLVLCIGIGLIIAAIKKQINISIFLIAAGAALGFLVVDLYYFWNDVILPVYLADALLQFMILIFWLMLMFKPRDDEPV